MNNLADCIIRDCIFEYIDISEYYHVSQVSKCFHQFLTELYQQYDPIKALKNYRIRKIQWFSKKLHKIPLKYLLLTKDVNIYLLLQDIYKNTNYIDRFKIKIPEQQCIESYLLDRKNNDEEYNTSTRHDKIMKQMKEDIHQSINSSISIWNKKNYYSKKIKNINNKK